MTARKPPRRKAAAARKQAGARRPTRSPRQSAERRQTGGGRRKSAARPGARGKLRMVRGRAPAAPPPPAFPQAQAGTSKQKVLFGLIRARVAVHAAIQGLSPASADEVVAPGRRTLVGLVLDLAAHDRAALHMLESALRGAAPGAPPEVAPASPLADWPEAIRRLHAERDRLVSALESVPEEPVVVWDPAHPFGALLAALTSRDRETAEAIKRWRTTREP